MTIERYRIAAYFVVIALVAGTQAFGSNTATCHSHRYHQRLR
jgi:hypothetical protein